jgi:hypothetical protein
VPGGDLRIIQNLRAVVVDESKADSCEEGDHCGDEDDGLKVSGLR